MSESQDDDRAREFLSPLDCDHPHHVAALTAAFAEVRREAIERCAKVAESEPEAEDAPPGAECVEWVQAACRVTKRSIAARIRSLAPEPPDQPGAEAEDNA